LAEEPCGICAIRCAIFSFNPMDHLGVRLAQRKGEREPVGAAVALDHDALEPDQRCAVVAARIDALLERAQPPATPSAPPAW
jgi:hypothetical protein